MKKILLLLLFSGFLQAQNAIIGAGFTNGWSLFGGAGDNGDLIFFDASAGSSRIKTLNPRGTGDQFFRLVRGWDGNKTQFGPFGCVDQDWTNPGVTYNNMPTCTNGAFRINCPNTTDNYVFKTPNGNSSTSFVYFRVQGAVRSVSSVSQLPIAANTVVGQNVVVTANLNGALSTGQSVYIRYTKDGFSNSIVTEMTGSGTTYTATIPAAFNTASANVAYYIFTSGNGLTISGANADWFTINLNNNGGSNYAYTVSNTWTTVSGATTWSNPASWSAGSVPNVGAIVNVNHNLTLDVDANVSGISIGNDRNLTVSEDKTLQLSGTLSVSNPTLYGFNVNGTLQLNNGYSLSVSPTYGINSTLIYNNVGSKTRAGEWPSVNSPSSVILRNNSIVNLNSPVSIAISKNLIVESNSNLLTNAEVTFTMNGIDQVISTSVGGRITGTDNGPGNNLSLVIANGSSTTISGDPTTDNDNERKFYIITVLSGGQLNLSRGILCRYGFFTVNGTLQINANGYVQSNPPASAKAAIYGATGKLIYNNGGNYTSTNFEWPAVDGPFDVFIRNTGTNVTLNGAKTVNGTVFLENGTLTNGSNLTLGNGATINRTGGVLTATPNGSSYNVVYGAHSQGFTTGFELPSASTVLNNLTVSNGQTVILNASRTVNGNVNITAGSFILGENTLNRNTSGGSFSMGDNTYLSIAGTNSFPSNYVSHSLNATSTTEYNGTNQNVVKLSSNYGNVILSNSGTKTLDNDVRASGNFTLQNTVVSQIPTTSSLTVGGDFNVLNTADFTVPNNAYLIQTKAGVNANVGSVKVNRAANIKRLDIVLWSSPVAGQNLLAFSPLTLQNRFFQYSTSANNWTVVPNVGSTTMGAAQGYGIRAPNNWGTSLSDFNGLFTGVPNSGDYTASFASSGSRFNLVGNPYPSTLNLRSFYNANSAKIENKFYFYEHTQSPANTTGLITNYGVMTVGGSTVYVPATDSPQASNVSNIQSAESAQVGQGFFVRANVGQSGSLNFTNAMRGGNNNTVFFRNNLSAEDPSFAPSMFRIKFTDPLQSNSQAVVGCFEDSTDEEDLMDTEGIASVVYTLYANKKLAIQGRSFPLNQGSVIPLGFRTGIAGMHKIDLIELTGIFQSQQFVLLHDLQLGQYHNLSVSPYEFFTEPGTFDQRFLIVFTSILSNELPDANPNELVLFEMNEQLHLQSKSNSNIKNIEIYGLQGNILFRTNNQEIVQYKTLDFAKTNQLIVVKVTTDDFKEHTFKVIF